MATLFDALNRTRAGEGAALRRTLRAPERSRTRDQEKASVAALMLAHYARARERFFLAVGFASTHVHGGHICIPSAAAWEGGRALDPHAALPPERAQERNAPLLTWPNWDLTRWDKPSRKQLPRFDFNGRAQREAIGSYYACATHVDAQIGALLDALDVLYLTPTTAFVVQGDHGFSLGRHGRWSKYHLYEDATRVPLVMMVPGGARGRVVSDVVESLDVMPTILDVWGVPSVNTNAPRATTPARFPRHYMLHGTAVPLEGESLLPYLRAGKQSAERVRRHACSEMREWMVRNRPADHLLPGAPPRDRIGAGIQLYVRTDRYAYTVYLRRPNHLPSLARRCSGGGPCAGERSLQLLDEQLFDHSTDAAEAINLAYDEALLSTRRKLLALVVREWNISLVPDRWGEGAPMLQPNRTRRLQILHDEAMAQRSYSAQMHALRGARSKGKGRGGGAQRGGGIGIGGRHARGGRGGRGAGRRR